MGREAEKRGLGRAAGSGKRSPARLRGGLGGAGSAPTRLRRPQPARRGPAPLARPQPAPRSRSGPAGGRARDGLPAGATGPLAAACAAGPSSRPLVRFGFPRREGGRHSTSTSRAESQDEPSVHSPRCPRSHPPPPPAARRSRARAAARGPAPRPCPAPPGPPRRRRDVAHSHPRAGQAARTTSAGERRPCVMTHARERAGDVRTQAGRREREFPRLVCAAFFDFSRVVARAAGRPSASPEGPGRGGDGGLGGWGPPIPRHPRGTRSRRAPPSAALAGRPRPSPRAFPGRPPLPRPSGRGGCGVFGGRL